MSKLCHFIEYKIQMFAESSVKSFEHASQDTKKAIQLRISMLKSIEIWERWTYFESYHIDKLYKSGVKRNHST